jgi:hypothetical protein
VDLPEPMNPVSTMRLAARAWRVGRRSGGMGAVVAAVAVCAFIVFSPECG